MSEETLYAIMTTGFIGLMTCFILNLLFAIGFHTIVLIERRLGIYPIISEQRVRLQSLYDDFFERCRKRCGLQHQLWYRRDQLSEEAAQDLRAQIMLLDGELEAIRAQCEEQSNKPCEWMVCEDFDARHEEGRVGNWGSW